jgi:transposase
VLERLTRKVASLSDMYRRLYAENGRLQRALDEADTTRADRVVASLRLERDRLTARLLRLEKEHARTTAEAAGLRADNEQLRDEVARLSQMVEQLQRASHRQSAPFSKNHLAEHPRRPGRRPGPAYGTKAHRPVPDHIDETVTVPFPRFCPECGGEALYEDTEHVYQQELPRQAVLNRCFEVQRGRCRSCGAAVRGRHPDQTSSATGAAGCHLGPRAVAHAVVLNKECGLSATKIARLFGLLGIAITPGGIVGLLHRAARAALPTYHALVAGVRNSAVVSPDETGWRVGGRGAWLWAFVGEGVTVYLIAPGRGFAQAAVVLGGDYAGVLVRDGWAPYRRFALATHQTCLAHLLRRSGEMTEAAATPEAKALPSGVKALLKDALALRDGAAAGTMDAEAYLEELGSLARRRDELVCQAPEEPADARLIKHLRREADALFSFLSLPGVAATNHHAERAIRPAVVNRKSWGGNLTWRGADTQQILASVLRTSRQQGRDPVEVMAKLLSADGPAVADLAIPGPRPRRLALPAARSP